ANNSRNSFHSVRAPSGFVGCTSRKGGLSTTTNSSVSSTIRKSRPAGEASCIGDPNLCELASLASLFSFPLKSADRLLSGESGLASTVKNCWLVKQEPSGYSWSDFVAERRTAWTGIRNYTARNN